MIPKTFKGFFDGTSFNSDFGSDSNGELEFTENQILLPDHLPGVAATMTIPRPACCFFDAFGTLIYPEPNAAVVYHEFGQRYGDRRNLATIRQLLEQQLAQVMGPQILGPTSPAVEVERWKSVVQGIFGHLPNWQSLFDELWSHFSSPQNWRLFADAVEPIRCLKQEGIVLGIASNFDARLYSICQGLPPLSKLDRIFISAELGWRKPSPEFFQAICERLGQLPSHICMIGDDWEFDAQAARACGWHSIHIDRRQTEPILILPDQTMRIRSLTQLPLLLLS